MPRYASLSDSRTYVLFQPCTQLFFLEKLCIVWLEKLQLNCREIGVSWHLEDLIEDLPEIPRISQQSVVSRVQGEISTGPLLCRETSVSRTVDVIFSSLARRIRNHLNKILKFSFLVFYAFPKKKTTLKNWKCFSNYQLGKCIKKSTRIFQWFFL